MITLKCAQDTSEGGFLEINQIVERYYRKMSGGDILKKNAHYTNPAPDYLVRTVKTVNGKDKWVDLGVAYKNARGSVTVYLSALPLNDKLVLIPVR